MVHIEVAEDLSPQIVSSMQFCALLGDEAPLPLSTVITALILEELS